MATGRAYLGGISRLYAAIAIVVTVLLTAVLRFAADPVTPLLLASFVLAVGLLVVSAFDRVRDHPAFEAVNDGLTAILFGIW